MSEHAPSVETKFRLLLEISRTLAGTLDLQPILERLLDAAQAAVACDAAGIFVLARVDPGSTVIQRDRLIAGIAERGFDSGLPDDPMRRLGRGIVGHVIATGETVIAPDVTHDPRYLVGRAATRSEVAVPIVVEGLPIGALNVESDRLRGYDDGDVDLLRFIADAAATAIGKAMLHKRLLARRRIDDQLAIAHAVQSRLLPEGPPSIAGFDVAAISIPTYEIGGDYYDYVPLPDGRVAFVVADVSGKGIPAALIMATFRALVRTQLPRTASVAEAMPSVDGLLKESTGPSAYVTAVCAVLDRQSGTLDYTNCGHNPPLQVRASGPVDALAAGGPALGFQMPGRWTSARVTMGPGDALLLYTDGVVETPTAVDDDFGATRLAEVAAREPASPASAIVDRVVAATRDHIGLPAYEDDFTLVVVRRLGA